MPAPEIKPITVLDELLRVNSTKIRGDNGIVYYTIPMYVFFNNPIIGARVSFRVENESLGSVMFAYSVRKS